MTADENRDWSIGPEVTELDLAIAHAKSVAGGLRQIGRASVADYLEYTAKLAIVCRERLTTRDLVAGFFDQIAANLERQSSDPRSPPGAKEGCAAFVRADRAMAAAIRAGGHLPGGPDKGKVATIVDIMRELDAKSRGVT